MKQITGDNRNQSIPMNSTKLIDIDIFKNQSMSSNCMGEPIDVIIKHWKSLSIDTNQLELINLLYIVINY